MCFYSGSHLLANSLSVRLGSVLLNDSRGAASVDAVFVHPKFDRTLVVYDVGLIRLSQAVELNDYVRTICLPPKVESEADLEKIFKVCVSVGFGRTSYNGKQESTPIAWFFTSRRQFLTFHN